MVGSVDSFFLNWDLQLLYSVFAVTGYILPKKPFRIHSLKFLLPKLVASSAWFVWRLLACTLILASRLRCGLFWFKLVCAIACPLGLGNLIGIWFWLEILEERGVHVVMCLQGLFLSCKNWTRLKMSLLESQDAHSTRDTRTANRKPWDLSLVGSLQQVGWIQQIPSGNRH